MKHYILGKRFLLLLLVFVLCLGLCSVVQAEEGEFGADTSTSADLPLPEEDPLLTVACVSDMHADYGLQRRKPYVRNSVVETLTRIGEEEDADILLVCGDSTSDNAGLSERGGWTYRTYQNVIETYRELASRATNSGCSLWAAGNHEHEAGVDDGYDAYAGYESIMKEHCGEPISVYRQKDDKTLSDQRYPEHIMGLHYNVKGFDFIVLNPPYSQNKSYSFGTFLWLNNRLATIGKGRTVFLVTHFPLTDGRGISTPSYGLQDTQYRNMMSILKKYPNVIYLHGHDHGNNESVYISKDTFERITSYTAEGTVVNDRNVIPTSFITSFVGSMSYYRYSLNPDWLMAEDPEIVQALMIYVYKDRIVFEMKNYGKHRYHAYRALKPWTVMRDVAGSLEDAVSGTEQLPELPPVIEDILVTDEVNEAVVYDKTKSIRTYAFESSVTTLESSGNTSLMGAGLREGMKLSREDLKSGASYDALAKGVQKAVNEFVAYEMTLKEGGEKVIPEGMVKVTMSVPGVFADRVEDITFGAYYVDGEILHMTDVLMSEDGKTLSFLLPELTPFALSARAVVAQDVAAQDGATQDGATQDGATQDVAAQGDPSGIIWGDVILACAGGVIALGGLTVLAIVLIRMWKKDRATPYQE